MSYARICVTGCGALSRCVFAVSSSRLFACYLTAGSVARAPKAFGLWLCICWSSRAVCRMRAGLMMVTRHQRRRFLHRRRRCLRVRCLLRLHGLWYLLALRRRRSGTIRTSRVSIAFRAVPRPTGNQEICHLLVTSARCHGDTSLVGCSSPLAVRSSRGLFSPGSPGLWFLHMRAHPLPCVDLCIFLVYAGCCRRPGRGTNTGLFMGGLQSSGSLLPEACRSAQVRLLPAAFRQRWLQDCPDVRCWWWGCQCVHLLLRGWHRHERVQNSTKPRK